MCLEYSEKMTKCFEKHFSKKPYVYMYKIYDAFIAGKDNKYGLKEGNIVLRTPIVGYCPSTEESDLDAFNSGKNIGIFVDGPGVIKSDRKRKKLLEREKKIDFSKDANPVIKGIHTFLRESDAELWLWSVRFGSRMSYAVVKVKCMKEDFLGAGLYSFSVPEVDWLEEVAGAIFRKVYIEESEYKNIKIKSFPKGAREFLNRHYNDEDIPEDINY